MMDIAEQFLINFVKSIIELKAPKIQESETQGNLQLTQTIVKEETKKLEVPKYNPPLIKISQINKPIIKQKPRINYSIQSQLSATEKLNTLIKDPYVNEIECSGAENPLSVKKSGMTQNTQIILSIDEIYEIIAEFSQKTRIPVISGRIKAALNDLVITAVLSETLGPRFIIQKKKPFQELII